MVNRCRCFHLCHYTWAQTLGIRWTAEHASIFMNSVWALLQKPMWYGWNSCKLSICWNHSKLFWADCKNPCAFWYFYVGVQFSWVTSTSSTHRFERIKYDTPFQRHTITEQSYVISCQCWSEKGAKLCNILSMLKRKIGSGGGNRALLRYIIAINNPTNIKNKWIFNKYCAIKIFSYLQCGNLHMDIEGAKNHINPTKHSRVGSIFTNKSLRDHPIAANTDIMIDLNAQSRGTIWNNNTMTRSVGSVSDKNTRDIGKLKLGWRN